MPTRPQPCEGRAIPLWGLNTKLSRAQNAQKTVRPFLGGSALRGRPAGKQTSWRRRHSWSRKGARPGESLHHRSGSFTQREDLFTLRRGSFPSPVFIDETETPSPKHTTTREKVYTPCWIKKGGWGSRCLNTFYCAVGLFRNAGVKIPFWSGDQTKRCFVALIRFTTNLSYQRF